MLKLDKDFSIKRTDQYNFQLVKHAEGEINPKTGKTKISSDVWHFPDLKRALIRFIDLSLTSEHDTAYKILNKLNEIEQTIQNLELKQ